MLHKGLGPHVEILFELGGTREMYDSVFKIQIPSQNSEKLKKEKYPAELHSFKNIIAIIIIMLMIYYYYSYYFISTSSAVCFLMHLTDVAFMISLFRWPHNDNKDIPT